MEIFVSVSDDSKCKSHSESFEVWFKYVVQFLIYKWTSILITGILTNSKVWVP